MLAQRLTQMETRLNLTRQENVDLKATLQELKTNRISRRLRPKRSKEDARDGRNFLASTATSDFLIKKPVVAFDAYRYYI